MPDSKYKMLKQLFAFLPEQVRKDLMDHWDTLEQITKEYDLLISRGERIKQKAARMGIRCPVENFVQNDD